MCYRRTSISVNQRCSPPQKHIHTLHWDSRKSLEATGAARSSMEGSQDRMLSSWSHDATLIPACTRDCQDTIYRICVMSWAVSVWGNKKKAKQKHVTTGGTDTQAAISAGWTLSASHHVHTCMCFFNYGSAKEFLFFFVWIKVCGWFEY